MTYTAHIFGFGEEMTRTVSEAVFFAGAEPVRFDDVQVFTRSFLKDPPSIIVLPLGTIERLDLHVMLGSDPRYDKVAVLAAVDDPDDPALRDALETCALDYFLSSQPYHLKRLAMAVMSRDPWSGTQQPGRRVVLAEANLGRRIALARALRMAMLEVDFVDTAEDLVAMLQSTETRCFVVANDAIATPELYGRCFADDRIRRLPWIAYGDRSVRSNAVEARADELVVIGSEPYPDALIFLVQEILGKPLEDLRRSRRLPMLAPVRLRVSTLQDSLWAYARDMSMGGMFIRTVSPSPTGTMLTVSFRVPTAEGTVQVGARVVWRKDLGQAGSPMNPAGMGIEFTRVSAPDGASIISGYKALTGMFGRERS